MKHKEFARLLEKNGWTLRRIKGGHHVYTREGYAMRISVPVRASRPFKIGLLRHLLKLTDLDKA
jgi:predicted RNA binding protein YcfA (HicA-like mRNA interferase family)